MSSQNKFLELNQYLILNQIGSGAFSKVYLIKDKNTNQKYAAKVSIFMVDENTEDQSETLALFREINLLSMLDHPAILKFIGYSQVAFNGDLTPTIITEYACNGSLYDLIQMEKSGLSIDGWDATKKLIIVYGIACGMSYLHQHKIIHRDLKPQNILLDKFLHPKISDFGLSKITESLTTSMNFQSQRGLKGTPIYMAPEIFIDEEYSEASDVYAFAIIVYEIFTLETPFIKLSLNGIIQKVSNGIRPTIYDDVPDSFKNLIQRCWSQEPDKRPSFAEIVEEMKTENDFITNLIDELEFYDYIDFIDNCKSSFDKSKQLLHYDEFVNAYGRNKNVKEIVIGKDAENEPFLFTQNNLIFSLNEDTKIAGIFGYENIKDDILIPSSIEYKNQIFIIKSIMKDAFKNCETIRSIQFQPNSELLTIDECAFLSSHIHGVIKLPVHLQHIGKKVFAYSGISKIEIPENSELTNIDNSAFYCSSIKSISLPSDIELTNNWCKFTKYLVDIKIIERDKKNIKLYDNCIIGKSDSNSDEYDVLVFVPRNIKTFTIPPFIKQISSYAFDSVSIEEIIIPARICRIGNGAFIRCEYLETVEFEPDSKICAIEKRVFDQTRIKKIKIPSNIKKICKHAFGRSFQNIEFEQNSKLEIIDEEAFAYSSIIKITIPRHVKQISEKAFYYCLKLQIVDVEQNSELQIIENDVFIKTSIESITLPSSFTSFKNGWCNGAEKLKNISIIDNKQRNIISYENKFILGKTDINSNNYDILVFASRDVGSFTIPPFIEHISCYAFAWSLIESITIPQQLKEICDGAFYECKKLHKVEIQNDSMLNSLGEYAFYCSKIESILIPPNIKEIHQGAFSSCKSLKKIIFADNSNLKIIGKYAFLGTDIQNIQIPATVEVIGEGSFEDCKSLIRIEIPVDSELRIIEKFAFRKVSIRSITIPQKFTEFKEEWCYETPNLTDIKINENNPHYKLYKNKFIVGKNDPTSDVYDILVFVPRNIKTIIIPSFIKCIASCAFEMSLIQSIFIPTKVSKICKSAFGKCKQLSQVDFANDSELQEIEENAFISTSIKKISIPSNVKKICERGFGYCEQLKKIIVPKNSELREIESDAFIRTPIESFFIPKHLVQLHRHAFSSCENISLVEIDQNTELKTFDCMIFQYAKKDTVFKIPSHVTLINYDNFKKIKPVIIKL